MVAKKKAAGRPKSADSAESHEAILRAARVHFARLGYARASVREIAKDAGYTTSTLYHYFGSKHDLYITVFRDAERRVAARYRVALESHDTTKARVRAMLEAAKSIHAEDPTVPVFLAAAPLELRREPEIARVITAHPVETGQLVAAIVGVSAEGGGQDHPMVQLLTSVTIGIALSVRGDDHAAYAAVLDRCQAHLVF